MCGFPDMTQEQAADFKRQYDKNLERLTGRGQSHGDLLEIDNPQDDAVNHPAHYNSHPSGVEAIEVCEHMGFNLGNAMKYLWRADLKGNAIEDLQKASWYINREIERRQKDQP